MNCDAAGWDREIRELLDGLETYEPLLPCFVYFVT